MAKKSLYDIPAGCICMGDGLMGMPCPAPTHATLKQPQPSERSAKEVCHCPCHYGVSIVHFAGCCDGDLVRPPNAEEIAATLAKVQHYPSERSTPGERRFPTGGDPKTWCVCGHHKMNHAFYEGLPNACNQTGCECREYKPDPQLSLVDAPGERQFPIGGDPAEWCRCGHHKLNHSFYEGMPQACNQTECECRTYRPDPQPSPVDEPPRRFEDWYSGCFPVYANVLATNKPFLTLTPQLADDHKCGCRKAWVASGVPTAKPVDDLGELERLSAKADWRIGRIVDYLASDIQEKPREDLVGFVRNEMLDEVEEVCQSLLRRVREGNSLHKEFEAVCRQRNNNLQIQIAAAEQSLQAEREKTARLERKQSGQDDPHDAQKKLSTPPTSVTR